MKAKEIYEDLGGGVYGVGEEGQISKMQKKKFEQDASLIQ